jgi:hypothetical protein
MKPKHRLIVIGGGAVSAGRAAPYSAFSGIHIVQGG